MSSGSVSERIDVLAVALAVGVLVVAADVEAAVENGEAVVLAEAAVPVLPSAEDAATAAFVALLSLSEDADSSDAFL